MVMSQREFGKLTYKRGLSPSWLIAPACVALIVTSCTYPHEKMPLKKGLSLDTAGTNTSINGDIKTPVATVAPGVATVATPTPGVIYTPMPTVAYSANLDADVTSACTVANASSGSAPAVALSGMVNVPFAPSGFNVNMAYYTAWAASKAYKPNDLIAALKAHGFTTVANVQGTLNISGIGAFGATTASKAAPISAVYGIRNEQAIVSVSGFEEIEVTQSYLANLVGADKDVSQAPYSWKGYAKGDYANAEVGVGSASLRQGILSNLAETCKKQLPIILTGHGIGGAIADLLALDLVNSKCNVVGVYTWGQPRIGNNDFVAYAEESGLAPKAADGTARTKIFRQVNMKDIVPRLPIARSAYAAALEQIGVKCPGVLSALSTTQCIDFLVTGVSLFGNLVGGDVQKFIQQYTSTYNHLGEARQFKDLIGTFNISGKADGDDDTAFWNERIVNSKKLVQSGTTALQGFDIASLTALLINVYGIYTQDRGLFDDHSPEAYLCQMARARAAVK